MSLPKPTVYGNYKVQQYHQNYGYDLKATLDKYPIKELVEPDQREMLIRSLQKGNVQMVTMRVGGQDRKLFIEANPQFKTINVYDGNGKMLNKEQMQEYLNQELRSLTSGQKQELNDKINRDEKREIKSEANEQKKESVQQEKKFGWTRLRNRRSNRKLKDLQYKY